MENIMIMGKAVPVSVFEEAKRCEDLSDSKISGSVEQTGFYMEGRGVLRGAAMALGLNFNELRHHYVQWYLDQHYPQTTQRGA